MAFGEFLVDPTFLFCVGVFAAPLYMKRNKIKREEINVYLTEPFFLAMLAALILVAVMGIIIRKRFIKDLTRRKELQDKNRNLHAYQRVNYTYLLRPLRLGERLRSRWYLFNGIVIHAYLDGLVGFFKVNPLMAANYAKIDRRYGADVGSFQGSTVHVLCLLELFIKSFMCIFLYWAFQNRHPARDALELLVCATQVYGTVMYIGQEIISGGRNLELDYFFTFSLHYTVYFWFAVVFGCALFILVPLLLGYWSFQRLCNQVMFYQRHHYVRRSLDHVTPNEESPRNEVPLLKN